MYVHAYIHTYHSYVHSLSDCTIYTLSDTYIGLHVLLYTYIHIYTYTSMYIHMHLYIYKCMHTSICIRMHTMPYKLTNHSSTHGHNVVCGPDICAHICIKNQHPHTIYRTRSLFYHLSTSPLAFTNFGKKFGIGNQHEYNLVYIKAGVGVQLDIIVRVT